MDMEQSLKVESIHFKYLINNIHLIIGLLILVVSRYKLNYLCFPIFVISVTRLTVAIAAQGCTLHTIIHSNKHWFDSASFYA